MPKVVKIVTPSVRSQTNTEVIRWTIKGEWGPHVWDELIAKLKRSFGTRHSQFYLSWYDGEDYCTVRDFEDLEEAIECMESEDSPCKGIRLFASLDKTEHHTVFGKKPDPEPEELSEVHDTDDLDSLVAKQDDDEPIPSSQWEMLNLDEEGQTSKGEVPEAQVKENVAEEEPAEERKDEEDSAENPAAAVATVVPAASEEDDAGASEAVAAATAAATASTVPDSAASAAAAAQPNPYLACMPPYSVPPYYPVTAGMQPMYAAQWAMAYPGIDLSAMQTPAQNVPSAPPIPQQPAPTHAPAPTPTPAPATAHTVPAVEPAVVPSPSVVQEPQPQETPQVTKPENRKKEKKSKSQYVHLCLQTLRSMGYTQDEKTLKHIIRNHKGNLNAILDSLNHSTA